MCSASRAPLGLSPPLELVWLSDGIEDGGALALADRLARLGEFHYYAEAPEKLARALLPPVVEGQAFRVRALRTGTSGGRDREALPEEDFAGFPDPLEDFRLQDAPTLLGDLDVRSQSLVLTSQGEELVVAAQVPNLERIGVSVEP